MNFLKIEKNKFISIGNEWSSYQNKINWLSTFKIKELAAKEKKKYGFISPTNLNNKQYSFIEENQNNYYDISENRFDDGYVSPQDEHITSLSILKNKQNLYSGAILVSLLITSSCYVKVIKNEFDTIHYWLVYINEERNILLDKICYSSNELFDELNLYKNLDNDNKIYCYCSNADKVILIEENISYDIEKIKNLEINEFFSDEIKNTIGGFNKVKILELYSEKGKYNKQIAIGTGVTAMVLLTYLYIYPDQYYKDVSDDKYISSSKESKEFLSWKKELNKNKRKKSQSNKNEYVDYDQYKLIGFQQIENIFYSQFYSKQSIKNNILFLSKNLPLYLANYKLNKISFSENKYLAFYSRIDGEQTTFDLLNKKMNELSIKINHEIKNVQIDKNGDLSIYAIDFVDSLNKNDFEKTLEKRIDYDKENNIMDAVEKLNKKIDTLSKKQSAIKNDVIDSNKLERAFLFKGKDEYQELVNISSNLDNLYKEMVKIKNKEKTKYVFDYDLIDASIYSYFKTAQLHGIKYNFSSPTINNYYPSFKDKKINIDPKISEDERIFSKSYAFNISSLKNVTNTSFYFSNLIDLIDYKNIKIETVEYFPYQADWKVTGLFFEKNNLNFK